MEKLTGREPARPFVAGDQSNPDDRIVLGGLTIRQHFAAMANTEDIITSVFNNDVRLAAAETGIDFLGSNLLFWIAVEAKLKVMKADALIKELNKQ